ncbi:Ig-like domain-containing protein [Microcella humidisoli]|uniref:Ig-like domain-containing protein n=1 Tax=Microcella humidisoli TaxID=2963406 RepID=A0ABY5FWW8_9MICO|nr:Ig-like domain-containing protein [Microcella humidisoli]UTT62636.1 Ig-like domain-containing protein [Microcella humidisoli]
MIRQWFARHRSAALTGVGGGLVAVVVATIAVVYPGFEAQRLDINDGAVWVVNGDRQAVGRANLQVGELDSVIPGEGSQLELVQRGADVIVVDTVNATAEIVDTARSEVLESVPLPPDEPQVMLAADSVVVHSVGSGETWVTARSLFADFDPATVAAFQFGPDSVVATTDAVGIVAVAPGLGEVYRVAPGATDRVDRTWSIDVEETVELQITIAGGRWAVLDTGTRLLHTESGVVDLSGVIGAADDPRLAQASDDAQQVLVAHRGGLVSVGLDGSALTELVTGRQGRPAAPVVLGDCAFAAWTDGISWRRCGEQVTELPLSAVPAAADLAFTVRDERLALNDRAGGAAWAVQSDGRLIDNWDDLIRDEEDERQEQLDQLDTPPELERAQQPPIAVDDEFGARPGRASVLPVLLNDTDPNGDVLVITEVTAIDPAIGRLDLIGDAQQLQLTLESGASGEIDFSYTITDGRGGSDSATVRVDVRAAGENGAPVQVRASKTTVAEGGTATAAVLAEWVDPDGDPIYLQAASIPPPDVVTFRPDGRVTISEAGGAGTLRTVALTVTDGLATGLGTLAVTVRPAGQTPIIAEPFVVLAYAGQEVRIEPLVHVRGGTGTIRLSAVPEKSGTTITPSFDRGVFRFVSDEVRTHYLEYVVTDGSTTATGIIRVDVAAPPAAGAAPITVPKTLFVRTLSNATIGVATADIDPGGGVLVVTGVIGVPPTSGIRAEVLDQRDVRITLTRPLDGPQIVTYRISNGLAESTGEITVIEIPRPDRLQPPVAIDDTITVRVGDAVSIPVLANDEHPDDEPITLSPSLVQGLTGESGLLFVAGDRLRYLAPDQPGDFTAVYEVLGPLGQERAQASVRISVREVNEATNQAPVTRTVTARVIAGDSVRVRIPVDGMDPDGDSVQVIGQESSPQKGAVVETGLDYLDYQAGSYSAGTDEFRYTVVDALGARSSGVVRIGISPRLEGARNPVANDDQVLIRPGFTVLVPVLDNDTDPDGSALTVTGVEANGAELSAEIVDGQFVRVVPPAAPGRYGLVYTIENALAGASQAFITIIVSPDAPLSAPVARDTVLSLTDILDRDELDVDVLARVFFAEGEVSELGLELVPGYESGAVVQPDRRVRVQVGAQRQIIPFQVVHPADPTVRSTAFIWVPGTDDALPQLDRRAPRIEVVSEETVTIDINDYVLAVGGAQVRLTDTATVSATQSNGEPLVVDENTLRFTSADLYFGPASLTFEVTDGASATDPEGRVATIVLPIEVTARENQPPVLIGAALELEPGQERLLDLVRVTAYPYPDDVNELAYSIIESASPGLEVELSGQSLRVRVLPSTPRGTTTGVTLGVRDDAAPGTPGRIQVTVVPSTRPLARPAPDAVIAPRSQTTTVRVLDNDQARNPFPGQPLRVVAVRGLESGSLPAGVSIVPSADGQTLLATISAAAEPVDTNLEYQVADATNDLERFVWGAVRISVQDVPDPVTNLRVSSFANRSLTIAWAPGASNNAPIERFEATVTRVSDGSSTTTVCPASPCAVPTPGNGSDNRVRISVIAVNAQGPSAPTVLADAVWSDLVPPAPALLGVTPLDHGLRIGWTKPAQDAAASDIRSYRVAVGPVVRTVTVPASDPVGTEYWLSVVDVGALDNGTAYPVSVSARNDSFDPLTSWNSSTTTGTPAGAPLALAAPTAVGSTSDSGAGDASVTVSWAGAFSGNGRAVQAYYVWIGTAGSPPACTVTGVEEGAPAHVPPAGVTQLAGSLTATTVSGLSADTTYRVVVYAYNGQGCTESVEVTATPRERPSTITAITLDGPVANGEGRWDFRLTGVTTAGGDGVDQVQYRLIGAGVDPAESSGATLPQLLTAGTSHYGRSVQVEVRGCRQYEQLLCGTWSAPFAVGVAVRIDVQPTITATGEAPNDRSVAITWTPVEQGDYDAVEHTCAGGDPIDTPTPSSCTITAAPPDDPRLIVSVTENGITYTREYRP